MSARSTASRSASVSSLSHANRNLPEDPKPSTPRRDIISPEGKDRLARLGLGYANALGKTAGSMTVVSQQVGELCGVVAGVGIGRCAQGGHHIFSSKPTGARRKKGDNVYVTVKRNTQVVGGIVAGGPVLLAGGIVNCALLGPVAGKLATRHMDKNNPDKKDRPLYSWRPRDSEQHAADSKEMEPTYLSSIADTTTEVLAWGNTTIRLGPMNRDLPGKEELHVAIRVLLHVLVLIFATFSLEEECRLSIVAPAENEMTIGLKPVVCLFES